LTEPVEGALDGGTTRSFRDWREGQQRTRRPFDSVALRELVLPSGILISSYGSIQGVNGPLLTAFERR
jgi:hypothetical protein